MTTCVILTNGMLIIAIRAMNGMNQPVEIQHVIFNAAEDLKNQGERRMSSVIMFRRSRNINREAKFICMYCLKEIETCYDCVLVENDEKENAYLHSKCYFEIHNNQNQE